MTPRTGKTTGFALIAAAALATIFPAVRHVPPVTYRSHTHNPEDKEPVPTLQVGTDGTFCLAAGAGLGLRSGPGDPNG
jgi:hypothetical protein